LVKNYKECPIYQNWEGATSHYDVIEEIADKQTHAFWPWDEPAVEKDRQDLFVNMDKSDLSKITRILEIFTHIERRAGEDYWGGRFKDTFKSFPLQRMAFAFANIELNSHAKFYNEVNRILGLDTEEFNNRYKDNEVLNERMDRIGEIVSNENDLISVASFSFIEGACLYTSFAFLKHFQEQECGKNLITNVCRGIDLSVGDEDLHAIGGATTYKILLDECLEAGMTQYEIDEVEASIYRAAKNTFELEEKIISLIFEDGIESGITEYQLKEFAKHRINQCLIRLDLQPIFEEEDDFVKSWFYKNINSYSFGDFFVTGQKGYHLDWSESKFGEVW